MVCPYCGQEMAMGVLRFDGRGGMFWQREGARLSLVDRLCGVGQVDAAECHLGSGRLPCAFCAACRKIIVDTDVQA